MNFAQQKDVYMHGNVSSSNYRVHISAFSEQNEKRNRMNNEYVN